MKGTKFRTPVPELFALASSLLMATGVLTRNWWVIKGDAFSGSLSPLGVQTCIEDNCEAHHWLIAANESEQFFVSVANVTLAGTGFAVLALVCAVVLRFAGLQAATKRVSPARLALLLCPALVLSALAFLLLLPDAYRGPDVHLGISAILFLLGGLTASVSAFVLSRPSQKKRQH